MHTDHAQARRRPIGIQSDGGLSHGRSIGLIRDDLTLERIVAGVALFLIGMRSQWHLGLTTGYVAALLLLPLTLPVLASFRWSRVMLGFLGLCLACGLFVATWTSESHVISGQARVQATSLLVGIVISAILVLWARTLMPAGAIAVLVGLGGAASVGGLDGGLTESWKFGYAIPVTVIGLGLVSMQKGWKLHISVLVLLGGVTLFSDARSLFATYVMSAGLLIWSGFRSRQEGRSKVTATAMVLLALFIVYKVADYLVLQGFLGEKAQERSIEDAARSGSTLLGGRPELAATYALMRDQVSGYGLGVLPSSHDVAVGNDALVRLGLQPTQDGFSQYMFGRQQFELHSIFGDLWANYGAVGLLAAGFLIALVLWILSSAITGHRVSVLLLFLACYTGWNIVSSPLWSAEGSLILFLGLGLPYGACEMSVKQRSTRSTRHQHKGGRTHAMFMRQVVERALGPGGCSILRGRALRSGQELQRRTKGVLYVGC